MSFSDILFGITLAFYCAGVVLYLWAVKDDSGRMKWEASLMAKLGIGVQSVLIVVRGIELHRIPLTNLSDSLVFTAWALMLIYLMMEFKYRITALGFFATLIALIATAFAVAIPDTSNPSLVPALRSYWSGIHVAACLIAYSSLILAFGAALVHMLQEHMLKIKHIGKLQQHLPSLDATDRLAYRMVALGFPLLTLGIITGALWAQTAWGGFWRWDPKETWSLITWIVYAAYLHVRVVRGWHGKWSSRLLIIGFGCILVAFLGVNFLPHSLHRYYW